MLLSTSLATLRAAAAAAAAADALVAELHRRIAGGLMTPEQLAEAQRALASAIEAQTVAHAELAAARDALETLKRELLDEELAALKAIPAETPIVLLPVRLETRYQASPDGTDLLIRIYPDDIHVDTHEPELTEEEEQWGRSYWEEAWRGGAADGRERQAWTRIADAFTPERAAWIVRTLEPLNPEARPQAPVDGEAPLTPAPSFPAPRHKPAAQTRAPLVQLMPHRWMALGYGAAGLVFTELADAVTEPLAAGPAPDQSPQPVPGAQPLDPGMAWLVDFEEALAAGMAIRVRLPEGQPVELARLVVMGLRHDVDPGESATRLAELLEAQHYTRGVELLQRGTATNNSSGSRAGFGASDIGHAGSFAVERGAPLTSAGSGSTGDRLAAALGVSTELLAHVRGAGDLAPHAERSMNAALWPSTLGYFLDQRLRGVLIDAELRAVRRHFVNYVRSGGPLSTIRFGRQPYGCLPVTCLDFWAPGAPGDPGPRTVRILQVLREAYRRAVPRVPRLAGDDLDQDLIAVLQMQAVSIAYALRPVLGPEFVENFAALNGIDLNQQWWAAQAELARLTMNVPGLPAATPQSLSVCSPLTRPFTGTLAKASAYPGLLAAAGHRQLRADDFPEPESRTLLDRLLRHGLLLEYSLAARRLAPQATPLMTEELEPELVDIRTAPTVSIWRRLTARLAGFDPPVEIGAYLDDAGNGRDPAVTDLTAAREALRGLASLDDDALQRLLRETLDLSSHRLDAWITSFATRRLDTIRSAGSTAVAVGGYGWVEDLKPGSARPSDGYLQGPSPDHAATAAMLASGYLSHRARSASSFAIDLSSKRVQQARNLLEGVRRGGSPAALLGYRIERRFHELGLDSLIQGIRQVAPLDADGGTRNVCHGALLLELWRNKFTDPRFDQAIPPDHPAGHEIDHVFIDLDDEVDALGDVLLTESVYQSGRGRPAGLVTSFDGLVRGESFGEAEVLKTPRHGPAFLYRIVALMPAGGTSPWTIGSRRARAAAEPRLNAWLGGLFGDPGRIVWRVSGPGLTSPRRVALSELGWAPVDVVSMTGRELAVAIAAQAVTLGGPEARVAAGRDAADAPETVALDEFMSFSEAVRQLVGKSTPLGPANLTVPEEEPAAAVDVPDLRTRATAAMTSLQDALAQAVAARESGDPAVVQQALARAAEFGLQTMTAEGEFVAIDAVERELDRRLQLAQKAASADPATLEVARLHAVFGDSFIVLPRFRPANGAELVKTWARSAALQGGDRDASHTWLSRNSMVREGAGRMADVTRLCRALGMGAGNFTVGQLPFQDDDRWCALPFLPGQSLEGRRLSIVAWGAVPADADAFVSGLLVDEWTERVPASIETTGLAFHYDEPESRAPQAILIAVAPDMSRPWSLDTLEAVLLETLDLARLRMVDSDAMLELDQYLPGTYVATNAANEAVSTDL